MMLAGAGRALLRQPARRDVRARIKLEMHIGMSANVVRLQLRSSTDKWATRLLL